MCAKFIYTIHRQNIFHLFDQSYQQLAQQHIILRSSLYLFLKILLSTNIQYVIHFHFVRKLRIKILHYLWLRLTFSHFLLTYLYMKQLTSVWIEHFRIKVKGLLKRHFKQLLTLVVKSSCFVFNDTYYQQIDGVAMGSPLVPTFANSFLVYYEHNWLKNCPLQYKPKFYRRYVDDIFLMFQKKEHVKKFFRYMNSRHRNIKLTFEEEQDNKISFLDISITRVRNELQTSLFRKKTFSGVYLNFNSNHQKLTSKT